MLTKDRRLAYRSVSANHCRKNVEAPLVAQNDGSTLLQRPFLREGHFFSLQCLDGIFVSLVGQTLGLLQERLSLASRRLT